MPYRWNHTACNLFILASFAYSYADSSMPQASHDLIAHFFLCWIISCCLDVLQFIHSPAKGHLVTVVVIQSPTRVQIWPHGPQHWGTGRPGAKDILVVPKYWQLWIKLLCCCCCKVASVVSDSVRPHRWQPARLPRPWDSPGKSTGVGCHFLLQCMKAKTESEVAQLCPTPSDPIDRSPPGSPLPGILQARVLEWGAIAFSESCYKSKYTFSTLKQCDFCLGHVDLVAGGVAPFWVTPSFSEEGAGWGQ